jgi:competence ComEA-like helix-hairpin-helix protein
MNRTFPTVATGFLFCLAFTLSATGEVRRCGASCLLAPSKGAAGASKQLAPHLYFISRSQGEGRIDINAASVEELQRLPGVGPALASRIVAHRRLHGPFKRPQDVIVVRGMSAKLYRRIADLIRV